MSTSPPKVLIWGIAGASLGMEIAKSLAMDGGFDVRGADISPQAYGHFAGCFSTTYVLNKENCNNDVCNILATEHINFLIAGGDIVARICAGIEEDVKATGATYVGNNQATVRNCSDKYTCFGLLAQKGVACPQTLLLSEIDIYATSTIYPLITKPRIDSGGSRGINVFYSAEDLAGFAAQHGADADAWVCQEYLQDSGNELTIGVLSQSNGTAAGSILLRRSFQNMLSVHDRSQDHLISSGSSQGQFYRDKEAENVAMSIANAVESTGPLNIQCRLKHGVIMAFEINPRFSASTFLRALAGVNEVSLYLNHLISGRDIAYPEPAEGLALRSFAECFVPKNSELK
jgi:carbamoyl-phosphate synthase large subunit